MTEMTKRPGLSLGRLAPLALILVAAIAGFWTFGDLLSFETLRENRADLIAWRDANLLLAALVYCSAYFAVVALSLPGAAAMTLAGGFLFGAPGGTALTVVGATLGATAIFLAARHGLGDALYARMANKGENGAMKRFEKGIRENEASFLLLIRLVPVVPFFVANLAPAFLGVNTRIYVLTTLFGIIPGTFVYSWIGSGLGAVFERGDSPDLSIVTDPVVLGPILGLAALAALPIILKPILKRKRVQ
ncbi:TVP38/TMEM64 family protein [Amaricoccus macauensis]|uniref:TVP38/TMEM64 family protein n=1 Tax=Amaricoccus macauensis TaxID=57001 RepID=UPI003C7D6786